MTEGRSRRGFTLVEVMVVVAIIGALSALAVVAIVNFTHVARVNTASSGLLRALTDARLRSMTQHCPHFVQINGFSYAPGGPVAGAPILRGTASLVRKNNCASINLFFEAGDKVLQTVNLGDPEALNQGVKLFTTPPLAGTVAVGGVPPSGEVLTSAVAIGYTAAGARALAEDTGTGTFIADLATAGLTLRFAQNFNDQINATGGNFPGVVSIPTASVATRSN